MDDKQTEFIEGMRLSRKVSGGGAVLFFLFLIVLVLIWFNKAIFADAAIALVIEKAIILFLGVGIGWITTKTFG